VRALRAALDDRQAAAPPLPGVNWGLGFVLQVSDAVPLDVGLVCAPELLDARVGRRGE
jgi:hypothetical protein